jgi:acrylyl-CoA reductase (NADPH)
MSGLKIRAILIVPMPKNSEKDDNMFKGVLLTKADGVQAVAVQAIDDAVLGEGDVTVGVEWSTLNYKDALAITGASPVVRRFPLVPGIDFAGTVYASQSPRWKVGDKVCCSTAGAWASHTAAVWPRPRASKANGW